MIKIENLTKYYGELKAVDSVSFEIQKGEILGLLAYFDRLSESYFRFHQS